MKRKITPINWGRLTKKGTEYKGREKFVKILRKLTKPKGGIFSREDLENILLENNMSKKEDINCHINYLLKHNSLHPISQIPYFFSSDTKNYYIIFTNKKEEYKLTYAEAAHDY